MATLENEKVITEKFIENAINDGNIEPFEEAPKNESEKLILDEISSEKSEKIHEETGNDRLSESCPLKLTENKQDIVENVSEEAELSREPQTSGSQESSQQDSTENGEKKEESETGALEENSESKDEWQDILGSGVIMKKILQEGEPDTRPHRSDKCFISYTCRLEDSNEEDIAEKGENYELGLGEGDVVQGLDVAIGLMNKKERCLLKIGSRLAFGVKGQPPNIPGDSTVVFDVELVDVQSEDDFETMNIQDKRRMGNKKRERGNWWYQRGELTLAVQSYRRALDFLDEVECENSEEKPSDSDLQQLLEDRLKVLNNMASAQIKMELYDQAQVSLESVLKCQPDNVKALYRKAKIYIVKNDLAQALKLLEKAKALEPDDALLAKEISFVNGLILKQNNSEREYARRMFGGSGPTGSSSKTKVTDDGKKSSGSKIQVWATLGATLIVGLAGVVVYKFRYSL